MSYQKKPVRRQSTAIHHPSQKKLSSQFGGLLDDPELCQMFDLIQGVSDVAFEREMWDVAEELEHVLDSILIFKDRCDRGVTGFYSRRKKALPLGTSEADRRAFMDEMTTQVLSNVTKDPEKKPNRCPKSGKVQSS